MDVYCIYMKLEISQSDFVIADAHIQFSLFVGVAKLL